MSDRAPITADEMDAKRSPRGGWNAATLAEWGVPWPPPSGWRKTILAHGIPYDPELNTFAKDATPEEIHVTEDGLRRMMDESKPQMIDGEPFNCEGELDIDPARLLQMVVTAVISYGHEEILWQFPEVLAFFGSRIPDRAEVAHLHNIDERMFAAADKWPNRKRVAPARKGLSE